MLAEAEIVVFILSVDVYQTVDFKSVRINKGLVSFPGGSVMKNSPANAGDTGSVPGWGRCPREGNSNPLHILAWKIPWTEEPGSLRSMESQRVRHHQETERTN